VNALHGKVVNVPICDNGDTADLSKTVSQTTGTGPPGVKKAPHVGTLTPGVMVLVMYRRGKPVLIIAEYPSIGS